MASRNLLYFIFLVYFATGLYGQQPRRMVAEWEPAWGTLIRYPFGIPSNLIVELAEDDSLYVLVESYYEKDQAIFQFNSWGVNLQHCRFLFAPTYSHWTRDWGPHYVFNEQGIAGIADPLFTGYPWVPGCNTMATSAQVVTDRKGIKGWEEDDAVNIALADSFHCPLISLPVYLTGGNIMVDGHGTAVSTRQMVDENYWLNEQQFASIAFDSLGLSNYILVENPEIHGIQHIDCYAKFLDEETILVKQVAEWNPEYACCEALAEHLGNELNCWGEPYNIIRIFCGSYDGDQVAAYTNSLILNKKVLVPTFGIESDGPALQTYMEAMPGYEVTGFPYASWYYYDALHCRTMGIFDRHMLRIVHKPLKGEMTFTGLPLMKAFIDDRSQTGVKLTETKLLWREEGTSFWNEAGFIPMEQPDSFYSFIPYPVIGSTYQYYIVAEDSSGRVETFPRTAPEAYFNFTYMGVVSDVNQASVASEPVLNIYPALFSDRLHISFTLPESGNCNLVVYNNSGIKMTTLMENQVLEGTVNAAWQGNNDGNQRCPSGVYFIQLKTETGIVTRRCILK